MSFLPSLLSQSKSDAIFLGLEHCEFVIDTSFADFMAQNSHISFNISAMDKAINPDISIALGAAGSVKFHHQNLADVIEMEKKLAQEAK